MKKIISVSMIFLLVLTISCAKPENSLIEVFHFKIMATEFEEKSDTIYLTKKLKEFGNRTFEVYSESGVDSSFKFALDPLINNENQIIFFEDTCNLISNQEFEINDRKIKIYKYYYDREKSADEESYIYYNPNIGLIAIYNLGWFSFDFFNYESTSGLLEKFKADTTGFIKYKSGSS